MKGAMKGLADSLDPESAYLTPGPGAQPGIERPGRRGRSGRRFDTTVLPARRRGARRFARGKGWYPSRRLHPRDRQSSDSRHVGVRRRTAAARCSRIKSRAARDSRQRSRSARDRAGPRAHRGARSLLQDGQRGPTGYVRVAEFTKDSSTRIKQAIDALTKSGATRFVIDVRSTARGDLDDGVAAARLFVKSGTLAVRLTRGDMREPVATGAGDGAVAAPLALLVDQGTAGAAEVFAAALSENDRADLVGIHTLGRAARQRLVKLPDQSGLWLTYVRYLTPDNEPIHETGLDAGRRSRTSRTSSSEVSRRRRMPRCRERSSALAATRNNSAFCYTGGSG